MIFGAIPPPMKTPPRGHAFQGEVPRLGAVDGGKGLKRGLADIVGAGESVSGDHGVSLSEVGAGGQFGFQRRVFLESAGLAQESEEIGEPGT